MTETLEDIRRKRLLYRALRRGFKEADLLIGGFAEASLAAMSAAELDEFETLLGRADHDLFAWIKGGAPAPDDVRGPVFERLCAFDVARMIFAR